MERGLVSTLHDELLPYVGPEIILIADFPPIDQAVANMQLPQGAAIGSLLSGVGIVARVKDGKRLERALRELVAAHGGTTSGKRSLVEAILPLPGRPSIDGSDSEPSELKVYFGFKGTRLVLGFSEEWVRTTMRGGTKGQRLADGEDFVRVFSHLDHEPSDLIYVNLPKLRGYIADSQVVSMVLRTNAEFRSFVNRFITDETMGVGLGSTSIVVDGGARTTNFGPPWMSGAAVSSGLMAALALPNLLAAAADGRTQQTTSDIEVIARACEGFSSDSKSYPGPTDGWVPISGIATYLEPVYIGHLPRNDAWQNPILYWSDGGTYRILSRGRDGLIDLDWTAGLDILADVGGAGDIVYGDGRLLSATGP